jgi:hypothetical protein
VRRRLAGRASTRERNQAPGSRNAEEGQVGGLEAIVLGVLVFVFGTLAVANAWAVIDAKLVVDDAAAQAARVFVLSPSPATAVARAETMADQVLTAAGRSPSRATVAVNGTLTRCSVVAVTVTYRVPTVVIPLLAQVSAGLTVRSTHRALVPPLAAGPSGSGAGFASGQCGV